VPLRATPTVRDALEDHAREGRARDPPAEVCGVLAGRRDDGAERDAADGRAGGTVTATRRVPNVADDPRRRYELDPAATVATLEDLAAAGLDHLGFYHSHPGGPPVPSATDRDDARWPGYVYAIVAPGGPSGRGSDADDRAGDALGAWLWTGDAFERLDVRVADVEG
jgi:proteasome lid subunit RPN8/RPN11